MIMADSPEFMTFKEAYYKLSKGITHPEMIAGMLWSRGFILLAERQDAEFMSVPARNRTISLLNAIGQKIEFDPEKFREFVRILLSDPSLMHLARILDPATDVQSPLSPKQSLISPFTSTKNFSEEEMSEWFKKIGLNDTDTRLLIDEGFGTGPGFMELTEEDIDDMKFTRAGKKILKRNINPNSQPVPMDTAPPQNAMMPIAKHPSMVEAQGGPPPPFPYTPPPEPMTADSIAEEINLPPYVLDTEFSDNYSVILAFAKVIPDWKPLAHKLYLSPQDVRAIETNVSLNFLMQCTETLKKWKSRFGFKAKYRMLVEAALANDMDKQAIMFCKLVQRFSGPQTQPRPPPQPAVPVMKELNLDSLIEALRPLTLSRSNNGQLSRGLQVPEYKLAEIEANNHHDIAQVRTEILMEWLKNDYQLTWQTLAGAVYKAGDGNLARRLMAYYAPAENGHM